MKRIVHLALFGLVAAGSTYALAQAAPETAEAPLAQPAEPPTVEEATQSEQVPAEETATPIAEAVPTAEVTAPKLSAYSDLRRVGPVTGDINAGKAKSELCAACHGPAGVSPAPNFPNLAGQSSSYLYWQLVEFKRDKNAESPMTPLASTLSDQDMRDLATYYSQLPHVDPVVDPSAPAPDGTQLRLSERLYTQGDADKGIPPCQGCHGSDARGLAQRKVQNRSGRMPYAGYPALRGQQQFYLQAKLAEYRDGKQHDATTDFVMEGVGSRLDDEQISVLSAYLSSLRTEATPE